MFENLQERLQKTFKSLRGQAVLTEENIQETMRELRLALLEADVNFKVVKQFIDQVQAKAVGQQVMSALSPGEQVIKIVRDELVEVLGKDTVRLKFASQPPTVVLMAGLQAFLRSCFAEQAEIAQLKTLVTRQERQIEVLTVTV